jgi:hypothetical protein
MIGTAGTFYDWDGYDDRTYSTRDRPAHDSGTITISYGRRSGSNSFSRLDNAIAEMERSLRDFAEGLRRSKAEAAALAELIGTDHPVRDCRESVPGDLGNELPGYLPSTPIRGPPK